MATLKMILLIAMRNLVQARVRTLFLGTALTLVTMLLVILMGLSQGISDNIVRSATTLSTGHVNVAGFFKATSTDSAPLITDASKLKKIVRENTEGEYSGAGGRVHVGTPAEVEAALAALS
mgnify:CR=1 FL=1